MVSRCRGGCRQGFRLWLRTFQVGESCWNFALRRGCYGRRREDEFLDWSAFIENADEIALPCFFVGGQIDFMLEAFEALQKELTQIGHGDGILVLDASGSEESEDYAESGIDGRGRLRGPLPLEWRSVVTAESKGLRRARLVLERVAHPDSPSQRRMNTDKSRVQLDSFATGQERTADSRT